MRMAAHEAASDSVFPGTVRDAELRAGGGAVRCEPAVVDARGAESRGGAGRPVGPARRAADASDEAGRRGAADAGGGAGACRGHQGGGAAVFEVGSEASAARGDAVSGPAAPS